MSLRYPPPEWGPDQLATFNALMNAVDVTEQYASVIARRQAAGQPVPPVAIARRDELTNHIFNTLAPAFLNVPPGT